jgi:hypothetical protein
MIIYYVEDQYDYGCNKVLGIFSTLEKAQHFLINEMDYSGSPDRYFICETQLDLPKSSKTIKEFVNKQEK